MSLAILSGGKGKAQSASPCYLQDQYRAEHVVSAQLNKEGELRECR